MISLQIRTFTGIFNQTKIWNGENKLHKYLQRVNWYRGSRIPIFLRTQKFPRNIHALHASIVEQDEVKMELY